MRDDNDILKEQIKSLESENKSLKHDIDTLKLLQEIPQISIESDNIKGITINNYHVFNSIIIDNTKKLNKDLCVTLKTPQLLGNKNIPFKLSFNITVLRKCLNAGGHCGVYFGSNNIRHTRMDGYENIANGAKLSVIDYINDKNFRIYGCKNRSCDQDSIIEYSDIESQLNGGLWEIIFNKNNKCTFIYENTIILNDFEIIPCFGDGYIGFWVWNNGKIRIENIKFSKI